MNNYEKNFWLGVSLGVVLGGIICKFMEMVL